MSLRSGANDKVVKTAVDDVLYENYDTPHMAGQATAESADLFRISSIDRAAVIELEFKGPGKWDQHVEEETVKNASPVTGNDTTHTVKSWKQDVMIPKEFYDDDQHEVVTKSIADMGRSARNTKDENAINVYVDGFATTTTPDGAYLWSNSHTNLNGDTIDNLETGAMSPDNLEVLIRKLYEQKDQNGQLGGHDPKALLVSSELFKSATVYTKSELEPDSTDNNLNYVSFIYPGLKVYRSQFASAAFSNATNVATSYYLMSGNHFIKRKIRESLNTTMLDWKYDKQDRYAYKGRFREMAYAGTWEGGVGCNGTA